jgi:microcystin-dependent protein
MSPIRIAAALFALLFAFPASAEVYDWSQTPGSNNTADTTSDIQWSEGMAPSDVNDSARAMMAELRKFLDDLGASATSATLITSAGTSTVYTLATEGSADNLENGRIVCFKVDEANGAAPTMNVDSLGAKEIFIVDGTALTGGEMVANTIQCLTYSVAGDAAAGAWLMRNSFITLESGGGLEGDGVTGQLQRSALTGDVTAPAGSNATTIANDAVTYAKMQDVSATNQFLGRDTAGSGNVEEITVANAYLMSHGADPNADRISFWDDSDGAPDYLTANGSLLISGNTLSVADADFGDITASSSGTAWAIDANSVALSTDTTGNYVLDVADGTCIDGTASAEGATYTPSLDLTECNTLVAGSGTFTTLTFNAGAVDPVFTFGSGTLVISALTSLTLDDQSSIKLSEEDAAGSSSFILAAPAALASDVTCTISATGMIPDSCVGDGTDAAGSGGDEAGSDRDAGDVTVSSSGVLITIENDAVTHAKYQNIASDSLLGRDTAATGSPEELSVGGGIEFTGSSGIQRSALTGDITAAAGSATTDIASGVVGTAEIATDGVGADEIAADAVGASEIGAGQVGTSEIATDGVGSLEIVADAVGTSEIATDGVAAAEIATDGVSTAEIAASAVGASEIGTDAVAADEIAAGAVGTSEIATDGVGTAEISSGAVDADEIAANAVGTSEIATDGVDGGEIATNAVQTDEIENATILVEDLAAEVTNAGKAVGEIFAFSGISCPTYSREANGAAVSRTTYSALFAVIAETWGQGDNSTTFEIPDFRGRFMRGWDHATSRDPDAASRTADNTGGATGDNVGSYQDHEYESHTHSEEGSSGSFNFGTGAGDSDVQNPTTNSTGSSGGNETRPKNLYVLYCVYTGV